jgi:hypothetical protein
MRDMTWRPCARRRRKTALRCEEARAAPDSVVPRSTLRWMRCVPYSGPGGRPGGSMGGQQDGAVLSLLTRHSAARESRPRVPRRRRSRTRPGRGETADEAGRDRRSLKPSNRRSGSAEPASTLRAHLHRALWPRSSVHWRRQPRRRRAAPLQYHDDTSLRCAAPPRSPCRARAPRGRARTLMQRSAAH